MTNKIIKFVNFTKYIVLPNDSQSDTAKGDRWDISTHPYGVMLAACQHSRLIPWHAVAWVVYESAPEAVESPTPNVQEQTHANHQAPSENPAAANTEPSGPIAVTEARPRGRASNPSAKVRGAKGH